jgi:hypothetical protein
VYWFSDVAGVVKGRYGPMGYKTLEKPLGTFPMSCMACCSFKAKMYMQEWGKKYTIDNSLTREMLGINFRPVPECAAEMIDTLIANGYIPPAAGGSNNARAKITPPPPAPAVKDDSTLTAERIKLIKDSWAKAMGLGQETVGVLLFKNIFTIAPGALQLFSFKDEPNLYEGENLKKHGLRVVGMVDKCVAALDDLS